MKCFKFIKNDIIIIIGGVEMEKVSSSEMKAIDQLCIKVIGIPGIVLMENAALKVINNIDDKYNNFTIVCGVGNNGGDGLAIARHLIVEDKNVDIFVLGNLDKASKDFTINYNILINLGIEIQQITRSEDLKRISKSLDNSQVTIDSIFGTGLTRNVEGLFEKTIQIMNEKSKYIISVDIPSGLNADNGDVLNICVKADKTITLQLPKIGLSTFNGKLNSGEIIVEAIGIPEIAIEKVLG